MASIRCFIGIALDETARVRVRHYQDTLIASGADVKWVEPHNLHISLKFIGAVSSETLPKITASLEGVAQKHHPFEISLAGSGAFPSLRAPRVIWIGISRGKNDLTKLFVNIESALAPEGIAQEARAFSPHLTLGRVRSPKNGTSLREALEEEFCGDGAWKVKEFILFKSLLSSRGPRYEILRIYNLIAT